MTPGETELTVAHVGTPAEIQAVRELLLEYIEWAFTLDPDSKLAPTFVNMERELATLPGIYAPPAGCLMLAAYEGRPAGCFALKRQDAATGELKRLYVRPAFRGLNIGRRLVTVVVAAARELGYRRLVLDSHVSMTKAHELYEEVGFRRIGAPPGFPEATKAIAVFMEMDLGPASTPASRSRRIPRDCRPDR